MCLPLPETCSWHKRRISLSWAPAPAATWPRFARRSSASKPPSSSGRRRLAAPALIWGCIPTKALLEHAHAYKIVQQSKEWGIVLGGATPSLDVAQVHARKDKIVTTLTKGIEYLFKKNGITSIKGTARLLGKGKVAVTGEEDQELRGGEIIVATGSQPRGVPGIEIDRRRIVTSDEAIHLKEVPKSMVILGSGAVGVEFGVDLQPLRHQGHDNRAAAAAGAGRRRGRVGGAAEVVREAGHHGAHGRQGDGGARERRHRGDRGASCPAARRSRSRPSTCSWRPGAARSPTGSASKTSAWPWSAATWASTTCIGPTCLAYPRSATSSRSAGRRTRSSRTCRRPRASSWPSGSPARTCGRSTTTTCPAAPTAIPRSAAWA